MAELSVTQSGVVVEIAGVNTLNVTQSGVVVEISARELSVTQSGVVVEIAGARQWYAGDTVSNLGSAADEGWIDLTTGGSVTGYSGPTITSMTRTGATNWNDAVPTFALGNLASFLDYSGREHGFAVGDDLTVDVSTSPGSFSGFAIDRTDGLRIFNPTISGSQETDAGSHASVATATWQAIRTLTASEAGAGSVHVDTGSNEYVLRFEYTHGHTGGTSTIHSKVGDTTQLDVRFNGSALEAQHTTGSAQTINYRLMIQNYGA